MSFAITDALGRPRRSALAFGVDMRKLACFLVAVALVALAVGLVGRLISGGEKIFLGVATVLKTNSFVLSRVGSPVTAVVRDGGPNRTGLEMNGDRRGFDSVEVVGSTGKESLKVYWRKSKSGPVEVYAIYRTKPLADDELVWGTARSDLH